MHVMIVWWWYYMSIELFSSDIFWTVSKHSTRLHVSLFLPWCTRILQVHIKSGSFQGMWKQFSHVIQHFIDFRGLTAILMRNGPSNIIFFSFRDHLRDSLPESMDRLGLLVSFSCGPISPCNISGWLCIRCLLGSLHFNDILPSEHNKNPHAEDPGWRISELPQCIPPLIEGARRLGDVQGGACELHALLHVLGNHKHELLLAAWTPCQLIDMVLSWWGQWWTLKTSWAKLLSSEMLPMTFPMPMPYCAVISSRETGIGGGVLIVNKNLLRVGI